MFFYIVVQLFIDYA